MKGLKFDKRKHMSNSPPRHLDPVPLHRPPIPPPMHDLPPYHAERYQSSNAAVHPSQYSPTRKKLRRGPEPYFARRSISASPPRRHAIGPLHPEDNVHHRQVNPVPVLHHKSRRDISPLPVDKHYDIRNKKEISPVMPRNHSRDAIKAPYLHENRYRSASPVNRYLPVGQKSYGPTLHERFSSVVESNRTEPRIRYSRADLEKITIDIKRNVREPSPPPRRMMNPSAHRANEGHRPIFDREEVKQVARGDPYYDRKGASFSSSTPIDLRAVENYKITRHRVENVYPPTSGQPVIDRWQNQEVRKEATSLDRDEREKDYGKIPYSRNYAGDRSRSRSRDRDFRSERYLDVKPSSSRSDYPSRPPPVPASETRNNVPYPHRKGTLPVDARHKLNVRKGDRDGHLSSIRSEVKDHYLSTDKHYGEPLPPPRVERREYHSPPPEPHKWDYKNKSPSREKFPDYSRRPDKYSYKSWPEKTDIPPRTPHYGEPDSREGPSSFRGSSRPFRGARGLRSRGYRGPSRGSTFYRGSFRGSYRTSSSPRGRGIPRR